MVNHQLQFLLNISLLYETVKVLVLTDKNLSYTELSFLLLLMMRSHAAALLPAKLGKVKHSYKVTILSC